MQLALASVTAFRILAGVVWAGTSFAMARDASLGMRRRPQVIAALVVFATGAYLWMQLHEGGTGPGDHILEAAAVTALLAFALQFLAPLAQVDAQAHGSRLTASSKLRIRAAASLLTVTIIGMAVWRYA